MNAEYGLNSMMKAENRDDMYLVLVHVCSLAFYDELANSCYYNAAQMGALLRRVHLLVLT